MLKKVFLSLLSLLACLLVLQVINRTVVMVDEGEAGVLWQRFSGTQTNRTYPPGLYVVCPLDKLYRYAIGSQTIETQLNVLNQAGESLAIQAKLRFSVDVSMLPILHQQIGPDYVERMIIPALESSLRIVVATTTANEFQPQLVQPLLAALEQNLKQHFIALENLQIQSLPTLDVQL